jgi:predicted transcriptional regulator
MEVTELKKKIRSLSIFQWSIAKKCGIEETLFSKIVNGHRQPTSEQKKAIAKALHCKVAEIFPEQVAQ